MGQQRTSHAPRGPRGSDGGEQLLHRLLKAEIPAEGICRPSRLGQKLRWLCGVPAGASSVHLLLVARSRAPS